MNHDLSKRKKEYKLLKFIYIPVIIAASYFISSHWYQVSLIRGDSMYPAYHNMQFVLIDKRFKQYTYGDVVAFRCDKLDAVLIKRIVGCPGDQVIIKDGTLYINDIASRIFPQEGIYEYSGIASEMVCLGENQYFVIGDNLRESKDSRYEAVGAVNGEDILGDILPGIAVNIK